MFKFIKNKFLFIVLISIVTLVVLIVGAFSLYKEDSMIFLSDGYILETTTKTNKQYYFKANTKYKENVEEQITFSDKSSNKVTVDPASFVHYNNGDIAFLQKGALVNLNELTSSLMSYYNITNETTIVYDNDNYIVNSNDKKISIESFIGRINDNKYIIAGKNLSLKIPNSDNLISGDYFEVIFLEEGIVKIANAEVSYQITAQDTYIYVGDDITINLGNGKIFYDGDAKMLLSQITINGDENIDLDVDDNKTGSGSGSGGSGSGTGEGTDGAGDGTGDGTGEGDGSGGDGSGDGTSGEGNGDDKGLGTGTGSGDGASEGSGGSAGDNTTASPQIELIEVEITSTTLDVSMQLNNATLANGNIIAYLTNVASGIKEAPKTIPLTNGTFTLNYASLVPSTEYVLTIVEVDLGEEKQYFQKTFKTKDLGLTLEKVYSSSDSLSYRLLFDENSDVTQAKITIYENNGTNTNISPNEFLISKEDLDNIVTFNGLKSNTSYSVSVNTVWINNTAYNDLYSINRIDTTLKQKPTISQVKVDANAEEVKFTINLDKVNDPDKSIVSYTYNIYLADDITIGNLEPNVVYSITKADNDALVLNLNEINELRTGVDYRAKIVATYNDNEMLREVATDYSGNFLIKSKPNISFELKSATMNKVEGTITLIDANCTVPINGRACSSLKNNFTLRYYKLEDEETTDNDTIISFDAKKLTSEIALEDLSSNTTYAVKVFGNYYDDDNVLHSNVQIGDTFYVTTDKSDNLYFEIVGDNISGTNKDGTENSANVVTFDAKLAAPQDSDAISEISSITLNLYSGRYNVSEKLIGTYTMTKKNEIEDFFNNLTINNSLFTDITSKNLGKLDSLSKMIEVTNINSALSDEKGKKLNSSYTIEVVDVYDSKKVNKFIVENNVYTFNLTSSYFLDSRIEINPRDKYITVTEIKKENLDEEEYASLSKTIKNLDELNDDTVVGVIIENSLSDILVDSAFDYEKVTVNYTIYNSTTKKMIKTIPVDMGNKYQPKEQIVYLDPIELEDGNKYFTRGYNYKIGFSMDFITEDGSNPTYTNDALYKTISIERQAPIYTQYIKSSSNSNITYSYTFKDIDNALYDKNIYYRLEKEDKYSNIKNALITDNKYHDVVIPINKNSKYSIYYGRKNTSNDIEYIEMTNYYFEQEYSYQDQILFSIINDNDNVLKLKLEDDDLIKRTVAYKVVIKSKAKSELSDYVRYFLSSKLESLYEDTGIYDDEGNEIKNEYKYIAIDYANISRFIGHEMAVYVYAYYDSGLVGIEQQFRNGLILENNVNGKYLNIYNGGSDDESYSKLESDIMGINLVKSSYNKDKQTIGLYNQLLLDYDKLNKTYIYNPLLGANYYATTNIASSIGVDFDISFDKNGITLNDSKKEYSGINMRVLKEANLKAKDNTFKFNTIIPTINVKNGVNTINSIEIKITPSGIYGNKQFIKDGKAHNKVYVEFYSDIDYTNKLDTLESNVTINGDDSTGYSAVIDNVLYKNLIPDTTYYFRVFAYIDGKYTRLYDSSSTTSYITKDYSISTLNAKGILNNIKFSVLPIAYKTDSSQKELTWKVGLRSTDNYKIRFEFYEPISKTTTTDPETGEEVITTNYRAVNFDGTIANSCDNTSLGKSSDGFVSNCYISVGKDNLITINNQNEIYRFTGNNFLFGDSYYKLVVYAIPYTNDTYKEEDKIVLYENDALENGDITSDGIRKTITIPELQDASASLSNTLMAGYTEKDGYYISFTPTVTDIHKIINNGKYNIVLKDEKGNIVSNSITGKSCSYYINQESLKKDSCTIEMNVDSINQNIKFTGLSSNTLYYVELNYDVYKNNVGLTEEEKTLATPFTDFTYTPIAAGITLGTITATQSSAKSVILTYNGSANLSENIIEVDYTISLKGGSSKTTGSYKAPDIFTISTDKTPKLTIDTSDNDHSSNMSFTFKYGNTYIITTKYYYLDTSGIKQVLKDQETGKDTFTTILNL